ncbi:hypothetical protein GCM10010109_33310 [Actinoplanes campanulatus]|nr:hypothetical protein GCM10010109_33310 [Actinoplanes campanulatus]GID35818.1 hypothetical protein Aca09nite_23240 [Actinoplanes campanulatus]
MDDGSIHDPGRKVIAVEKAGLTKIQEAEKYVFRRRAVESEPKEPAGDYSPVEVGDCGQSGPSPVRNVASMYVSHRPKARTLDHRLTRLAGWQGQIIPYGPARCRRGDNRLHGMITADRQVVISRAVAIDSRPRPGDYRL